MPGALLTAILALAVITTAVALWLSRTPGGPAVAMRLTQLTFSGNVLRAEISPDGELLAYVEEGEPTRLLVLDLTGERPIEIASIRYAGSLRWSPDGSLLLFAGVDSTGQGVAATYPRLGGTRRSLPIRPWYSVWSPDGLRVAQWAQAIASGPNSIRLTTLATGDSSRVSTPDSLPFLLPGDWSPDGRFIALPSVDAAGEHLMLWTVALDGSGWRLLVRDTLLLSPPRWSPRGDAVYYFRGGLQDTRSDELRKIGVAAEGKRRGDPELLQTAVDADINPNYSSGLSLSADGRKLVFVKRKTPFEPVVRSVGRT